jgi:hypothetical protein
MLPTQTYAQTMEDLDSQVTSLNATVTILHQEFLESLKDKFNTLTHLIKGKHHESHFEDIHSSHSEHPHSSHSHCGPPYSWNNVPKGEILKFDGFDLVGWVSQMEHYFSLHDIRDDETKFHVGVLYLDQ